MAFENEEDYLDNLLKSITSEDNGNSGEDLFETDSETQMPETFVDSQEDVDEDVFERLLQQQEEELRSDGEEEQSAEDEASFMEALLGNHENPVWEEEPLEVPADAEPESEIGEQDDLLPEETVLEDTIAEDEPFDDEAILQMENTEFPELDNMEIPQMESAELPEIEVEEFPELDNIEIPETEGTEFPMMEDEEFSEPEDEVHLTADNEMMPELEDIVIPEADVESFAGDFTEDVQDDSAEYIVEDGAADEDFTQYPDSEEDALDSGNELIGQIDGLFNDVEEELEEERGAEQFGVTMEEDGALTGGIEEPGQEVDYSNMEVDDELKELLGVESAEQLADIPSESEGLSENELVKLAAMESAASFELDSGSENGVAGVDAIQKDDLNNDGQGTPEEEYIKKSGGVDEKAPGLMAKLLSIFKRKNDNRSDSSEENENQKVLDELFDENGELLDDDKKIKKKGLFFKSGEKKSNILDSDGENDEEDDIESPEEIARKEEKARKKKEKKEKKEKEKQEKKEKKEQKPKKEKKPKVKKEKPPVNPADLIHVKPVAIIIMAVIVAGIVGYVYFFVSSFNYNNAMDRAAYYMADKRYTNAYRAISGIKMKSEEDIALQEQIVTIMYVQHYYDAYERYLKVDLQFEALDSLIRGVKTYDDCYQFAVEQGITADYEIVKAKLVAALEQYGITEAMARTYGAMTNYTQYKYILEGYGGVSNDSGN